jgi:ribosomal protein L21E
VSALRCGRLTGFSIERLLRFLAELGNDVDIVVTPTARLTERPHPRAGAVGRVAGKKLAESHNTRVPHA